MDNSFSFADYRRMYAAKGARLPIHYFVECHLFDLLHGTDTHSRMLGHHGDIVSVSGRLGFYYMCSWTSVVNKAFRVTRSLLGDEFDGYAFVDIGSGKGKVVLQWMNACRKRGIRQSVNGMEYDRRLVPIAESNSLKMFGHRGNFYCDDVLRNGLADFGRRLILYLYNPFDDVVLGQMLDGLSSVKGVIIYNNPVYRRLPVEKGWRIASEYRGFHPNQHLVIYTSGLGA